MLKLIKNSVDIFCFQEVTDDFTETVETGQQICRRGTYRNIQSIFGYGWDRFFIPHQIEYWDRLYDTNPHSKFAKITHGCAVFIKKKSFSKYTVTSVPLGNNGNNSAWIDLVHVSGCPIQLIGIHLDDTQPYQTEEFDSLTKLISTVITPNIVIMGDYNTNTIEFLKSDQVFGLKDSLYELSVTSGIRIYNKTYSMSDCIDKYLDHILYNGPNLLLYNKINMGYPYGYPDTTISGVIDFGLHDQYEGETADIEGQNNQFLKALDLCGSDHFPVVVTFIIDQK